MQPLDVCVYSPFKAHCKVAFKNWMTSNPGKRISSYEIADLAESAFSLAFNKKNIISGFEKTGIWPFSNNIFDDDAFLAAQVTDRPVPDEECLDLSIPGTSSDLPVCNTDPNVSVMPQQIRPYPHVGLRSTNVSTRGRKKGKSRILTDTPEKNQIETERREKNLKKQNVLRRKLSAEFTKSQNIAMDRPKGKSRRTANKKRMPSKLLDANDEGSSSDNEGHFSTANDSDITIEDFYEPEQLLKPFDYTCEEVAVMDFLLIKFCTKKTVVHYVGQVEEKISNAEVAVKFLKRKDNTWTFTYPILDDISTVDIENVVFKLPPPSIVGGTSRAVATMSFGVDLSMYTVK